METAALTPQAIVYKAVNLANGHWYVGFTTRGLPHRERQHRTFRSHASLLQHAIKKHGQANFVFETLADFDGDEELAKLYEREMIEKYQPEYNLNYGGDGGTTHPDTRQKISRANRGHAPVFKGQKFSPEALTRFRATKAANGKPHPRLGAVISEELREKMRAANKGKSPPNKGKSYSLEIRQRMTEAAQNRKPWVRTEAHKNIVRANVVKAHAAIRKAVIRLNDGRIFESARAASAFYGWPENKVSKIITGQIKNHPSGLRFAYLPKDANQ